MQRYEYTELKWKYQPPLNFVDQMPRLGQDGWILVAAVHPETSDYTTYLYFMRPGFI